MAALACLAPVAQAAISVPTSVPLTFDAPVVVADWATLSIITDGATYTDANGLDAGIQNQTSAAVIANGAPPEETSYAAHGRAYRNSSAATLFTRPTGNGASLLMAILQNDSGSDAARLTIAYDLSDGLLTTEEIVGHRVYYSLSGQAGSWVVIPELCTGTAGRLNVTVNLTGLWPAGGTLYLLWADDNGNGVTDGYYAIDNVTLSALPAVPPVIVTQPPAETTVEEAHSFSLAVTASGAPLNYQWYKEGRGAIDGANGRTYSVAVAALGDAGNYFCVVYNALASDTSTLAHVTVNRDTTPPAVVRAFSYPTFDPVSQVANQDRVIVEFNERLDLGQATDTANYSLSDGVFDYPVATAALTNDGRTVVLTTALMFENTEMALQMTYLRDWSGNEMDQTTVPFRSWVSSAGNGLLFEVFNLVDPNTVNTIAFFTNSPNYPNSPDLQARLWAFDSRLVYSDDSHEHYGSRTRGLFIPPYTGNWRFSVRSDDPSQVFLNPSGPSASGKVLVVEETGSGGDWNRYQSAPIPLQAGQGYYIEALQKEGTGVDYVKVAAWLDGTAKPGLGVANTAVDTNALTGTAVCAPLAPPDIGGVLTLVGPGDVSVPEYQVATFAVAASNPSGLPMFYQWRSNGVDIPGATGPSYSFRPGPASDRALISVQVAKIGSVAVSREATLTVTPDVIQPTVVAAHGSYLLDRVVVSFSELVDPSTATDTANYAIPGFSFLGSFGVLDATGTNVILTLDGSLTPGQVYDLTVESVLDLSLRNAIPSTTLPLHAWVLSRGFAMEQLYFNIPGAILADLTASPKYPNSPDQVNYQTTLEGPTDTYDLYGTRLSGWVMPETSGEHVFYFCSQEAGQFSLSPDSNPASLARVAQEISFSGARTWTGPGNNADRGDPPSNISTQMLAASQMYAFEALAKGAASGDNSGVNWKQPGQPVPNNGTPGIPGAFLYALAEPEGASLTITQQPANAVAVYYGASAPVAALDQNFNASNGGFTVTNYGNPIGPWSYNANAGTWTNFGPGPSVCTGPYASGLNAPAITLANGGAAVLTFTHRYNFEGYRAGDSTAWDGGQVRVSLNGGPFRTLPPASFTLNGYVAPIGGDVILVVSNTPGFLLNAFVGESPGYATRTFLTSVANLGFFNRGDTLAIQFLTSWDECAEGLEPNWELDSVKVEVAAGVPTAASFTVGASSTYRALPNSAIAYVWQRDTGTGFGDIPGAYSPTYTSSFDLADSGTRFRCLVYSPAASATSAVATLTVTLPLTMVRQGSSARISWPLNNAGFELQRSAILPAATWTRIAPPYPSDGTSYYVNVTVTSGNTFYRLRKP